MVGETIGKVAETIDNKVGETNANTEATAESQPGLRPVECYQGQKDCFEKAYEWVGAKYYRVVAFNLMAVALFGAISYGIGKPIWENAKAKNEARLEQKINEYESMKRHKVRGRPIYALYNDCIVQDESWGVEEREEKKEAFRAAVKKMNNMKPDDDNIHDYDWPYVPCNNPAHASEQEPAPQK